MSKPLTLSGPLWAALDHELRDTQPIGTTVADQRFVDIGPACQVKHRRAALREIADVHEAAVIALLDREPHLVELQAGFHFSIKPRHFSLVSRIG